MSSSAYLHARLNNRSITACFAGRGRGMQTMPVRSDGPSGAGRGSVSVLRSSANNAAGRGQDAPADRDQPHGMGRGLTGSPSQRRVQSAQHQWHAPHVIEVPRSQMQQSSQLPLTQNPGPLPAAPAIPPPPPPRPSPAPVPPRLSTGTSSKTVASRKSCSRCNKRMHSCSHAKCKLSRAPFPTGTVRRTARAHQMHEAVRLPTFLSVAHCH